ncbi:MAG: hypothetical protein IJ300_05720 [Clostridia bacterium]|nr:hypothetical protein [Clostridia bacterium]
MFSKEYHFKYSDLDNRGSIKLSTVVDLLQDISIIHSANVGYTLEKMQEISLAMLLHGWRIKLTEPLRHDCSAEFRTGIMKVHRCDVIRKYEIVQEGRIKGIATADWFSFDTEKKSIIRVPEEINSAYDTVSEPDNGFPLARLKPESHMEFAGEFTVTKRDLDTNNHMNNVKSVEVALDYFPDENDFSELQVVYIRELHRNDRVSVFVKDNCCSFTAELRNEAGEACVIVSGVKGE